VRRALEAGSHVLVEKPLADTTEATAELIELATKKDRLLCPVHQFLFQPGFRRAFDLLEHVGPLLHVNTVACSAGAETGAFADDPDALIAEIVPHPLALLARLFPGMQVSWQAQHPRPGELRATTTIDSTSVGVLVSAAGRPTANALRLIGARGSIEVDLFHGFAVLEHGDVSRLHKIAYPFARSGATLVAASANLAQRAVRREPAYPGLRELIGQFYAAAHGLAASPISAREIVAVAVARDALIAALGRAPTDLNRKPTVDSLPQSRPDPILKP
jgi:predicted dehydrogenase